MTCVFISQPHTHQMVNLWPPLNKQEQGFLSELTDVEPGLLVSAGHLCDLQGLFSEIDNLCRVNN